MVYLFLEPPEYSFINDTQEREDWGAGWVAGAASFQRK